MIDEAMEPERYELREAPGYLFGLNRREFLKAVGGGVVVILALGEGAAAQESGGQRGRGRGGRGGGEPLPREIGAWLRIGEDGTVTVYTGKAEMGQNIRTSLSQAVAEELRLPVGSIRLVMADTALTPFDMGTFGSRTTPTMSDQLRRVAAAAREALIDLAAAQWQTDRSGLAVADGKVTSASAHRSADFAQLTKGQQLMKVVSDDQPITPAGEWKISGKPVPKVDGRDFVTGRHRYAADQARPGMLHGKVVRPGRFRAQLASVDTSAAEKIAGVTVVRDGDFLGVTAPDVLTAERAAAAIRAEWNAPAQPSSKELYEYLKSHPAQANGFERGGGPSNGSIDQGLAAAKKRLERTYTVAYIQHAPLEPRAAVAEWNGDQLTVWTGTQRPFGVRSELAQAFRMPEEKVRVIVPDTGAAYGGKHTGEAAVEAARLAKAAKKPVKLVWTREEEFTWAYFRPAGVIEVKSGIDDGGRLTAWEFHNYNSGAAGIGTPYEVANAKIEFHATEMPLRQGSYRALAATANHFARETHMDELAHEAGADPLEFRRKNLKNERVRAVLDAAAERLGWAQRRQEPGRGYGIAAGTEKGGNVATAAEVTVDPTTGAVRVERLVTAFECGAVVNPEQLANQIAGAAMMGLGGALFEAIEFDNGQITNPHFAQYRVPRFGDLPKIETVLLDRRDLPSAGAGETPIVCVAPAIGNAIFAATGVRLRAMPLAPNGVKRA